MHEVTTSCNRMKWMTVGHKNSKYLPIKETHAVTICSSMADVGNENEDFSLLKGGQDSLY